MRIWFIHPEYYDKKGILAQWNEALILRNVIYGSRNQLTVDKLKEAQAKSKKKNGNITPEKKKNKVYSHLSKSQLVPTTKIPPGYGWLNHPFSKRILRYKKELQKKIINTYLNYIKDFGKEFYGINFNLQYLDIDEIDNNLRLPILEEHVRKDMEDSLDKMKVRDTKILEHVEKVKKLEDFKLNRPFYLEKDIKKYLNALSPEYLKWCEKDIIRVIGTEIVLDEKELNKKYDFENIIEDYIQKEYNEKDFFVKKDANNKIYDLNTEREYPEPPTSKSKSKVIEKVDINGNSSIKKTNKRAFSEKKNNNIKIIKESDSEDNISEYVPKKQTRRNAKMEIKKSTKEIENVILPDIIRDIFEKEEEINYPKKKKDKRSYSKK